MTRDCRGCHHLQVVSTDTLPAHPAWMHNGRKVPLTTWCLMHDVRRVVVDPACSMHRPWWERDAPAPVDGVPVSTDADPIVAPRRWPRCLAAVCCSVAATAVVTASVALTTGSWLLAGGAGFAAGMWLWLAFPTPPLDRDG